MLIIITEVKSKHSNTLTGIFGKLSFSSLFKVQLYLILCFHKIKNQYFYHKYTFWTRFQVMLSFWMQMLAEVVITLNIHIFCHFISLHTKHFRSNCITKKHSWKDRQSFGEVFHKPCRKLGKYEEKASLVRWDQIQTFWPTYKTHSEHAIPTIVHGGVAFLH